MRLGLYMAGTDIGHRTSVNLTCGNQEKLSAELALVSSWKDSRTFQLLAKWSHQHNAYLIRLPWALSRDPSQGLFLLIEILMGSSGG
jgi:hypothetical protein